MCVELVWATPKGDDLIAYIARVSSPENQGNVETSDRLISYLIKQNHWSPFDMVNMCVSVRTSRAIGRQILRHWSIHPQEFSQRYAEVVDLDLSLLTKARCKGSSNRQSSIETDDPELIEFWNGLQEQTIKESFANYKAAIDRGIATELARNLLPEGLTPTHLYLNGTVRSWIHYLSLRRDAHTQREHRDIADYILAIFCSQFPNVVRALVGSSHPATS